MNKHIEILYKVMLFVFMSTVLIIVEIILYEYIQMIFPTESTFLGMPFNTATFVFAMLFVLSPTVLFLVFFYIPKTRELAKKVEKRKRLV